MHLTNKYLPEIAKKHSSVCVIAFTSQLTKQSLYQQLVIQVSYESSVVVQSVFISCQNTSFTRESLAIISPLTANSCQTRFVILHSNKRATGIRLGIISLTAEVLAPVVQRLNNAIHRINRYPVDKC